MAKSKTKNKKKKITRVAILITAIALISYIIYTLINLIARPTDIFMVSNGEISFEESTIGYVIREETVIKGTNYTNGMVQIKTEGEKIAKNDAAFRYYSNNEDSINEKITQINTELQKALEGQTDLFSSDIKSLESQIENKIYGLKNKNDIQEITEYKRDINTYITKTAQIKGDLSTNGSVINELITEKANYENQLRANSEYINAPIERSGII